MAHADSRPRRARARFWTALATLLVVPAIAAQAQEGVRPDERAAAGTSRLLDILRAAPPAPMPSNSVGRSGAAPSQVRSEDLVGHDPRTGRGAIERRPTSSVSPGPVPSQPPVGPPAAADATSTVTPPPR